MKHALSHYVRYLLVLGLIMACWVPAASAQVELVDAFPYLSPFNKPVDLQVEDGRFYVVEQEGLILSFANDSTTSRVDTLIDLRAQVRLAWLEDGLLSLVFHPNYAENGHAFVYYLVDDPLDGQQQRSVLARYTRSAEDPLRLDPASRQVVLEVPQPDISHNGGGLAFGPDGYLYLSMGDGGCCADPEGHGPDPTTLLGTLLRLDVDHPAQGRAYGIPPDNPFVGNTEGIHEEIFAYGFRNPWRFSFDSATGDIWLGDVGEGSSEEIDLIEAGQHYGWSVMEGSRCIIPVETCEEGLAAPVWEYYHSSPHAVVGGYVYRGMQIPELVGKYVYGDWGSGRIWALLYDASTGEVTNEELIDSDLNISTFGVDEAGELYVVDRTGGRIHALRKVEDTASEEPFPTSVIRFERAGPNPVQTETAFVFESTLPEPVRVAVYNTLGQEVAVLFEGPARPGVPLRMDFDARGLPAGVYFCRVQQGGYMQARSLIIVP